MTKPAIRPLRPAKTGHSVHLLSKAMVLAYPSLDSLEAVKGVCDQRRLMRLRGCTAWSEASMVAQVLLYTGSDSYLKIKARRN